MAERSLTDDDIRTMLSHLQGQIDVLSRFTGQMLAHILRGNAAACDDLDNAVAHWSGITEHSLGKSRVIDNVRKGLDVSLAASRSGSRRPPPPPDRPC